MTSASTSSNHSLPALWRHAMKKWGRWQGYAWSTVVVAGAAAYAMSLVVDAGGEKRKVKRDADGGDASRGERRRR
jgi:hypothetical protein